MPSGFYIGKRLSFADNLCTVRYVGEVTGTKGQWLGVEWDDPFRGKHAGKAGGVQYFECKSDSGTSGSFIRPTRKADLTRSFLQALRHKYAPDDSDATDRSQTGDLNVAYEAVTLRAESRPIRISGKEVEEVGFDKIRRQLARLDELKVVILDGLRIKEEVKKAEFREGWKLSGASEGEIRKTCPSIVELDLSRNLLEDWYEVAFICQQLPNLRELKVDGNRFKIPEFDDDERSAFTSIFSGVKSFSLENTLLSWAEIQSLASLFPALTTLTLCANQLTSLSPPSSYPLPKTIATIDLSSNAFTTLSTLKPLTTLPTLHTLLLPHNAISTTHPADTTTLTPPLLPHLTHLDLAHNALTAWPPIDSLPSLFPHLTSLRLSHNPLFHTLSSPSGAPLPPESAYMLALARLPALKTLNYTPITAKDRLNADTYYLSSIAAELARAPADREADLLRRHPRWEDLCAEYGAPAIRRVADEGLRKTGSVRAGMVALRVRLAGEVQKWLSRNMAPCGRNDGVVDGGAKQVDHQGDDDDDENGGGGGGGIGDLLAPSATLALEVPARWTVYAVLGLVARRWGLPRPFLLRLVWETGEWEVGVSEREMVSADTVGEMGGEWDSEDEEGLNSGGEGEGWGHAAERCGGKDLTNARMREVDIVPGTRGIGTWIDGEEGVLRVEWMREGEAGRRGESWAGWKGWSELA